MQNCTCCLQLHSLHVAAGPQQQGCVCKLIVCTPVLETHGQRLADPAAPLWCDNGPTCVCRARSLPCMRKHSTCGRSMSKKGSNMTERLQPGKRLPNQHLPVTAARGFGSTGALIDVRHLGVVQGSPVPWSRATSGLCARGSWQVTCMRSPPVMLHACGCGLWTDPDSCLCSASDIKTTL